MAVTYTCKNCGAALEFDAAHQCIACPHCGQQSPVTPMGHPVKENALTQEALTNLGYHEKESTTLQCQSCGAKLEVDSTQTSLTCPYCGSNMVVAQTQEDVSLPDGVIPFAIDKNGAMERLRGWMTKRWLAPNALKRAYRENKMTGLYLPYFTFDANAYSSYTAQGGRDRTVSYTGADGKRHTRVETDWFPTSGNIQRFIDDVIVCASTNFDQGLLGGVQQFNTQSGVMPYSPDYMAGYGGEVYTVTLYNAAKQANEEIGQYMVRQCEADVLRRYSHVRFLTANTTLNEQTYKYIYAPIYATSYHYRNKNYSVLLNGQTGQVKGEYPKSACKIGMIITGVILALSLLVWYSDGGSSSASIQNDIGSAQTAATVQTDREEHTPWDYSVDNLQTL